MQPIRRMVGYVRMGPETSINTDELRRNEERLRLLVERPDYAIFMLDPRGNVLTWNAGAERLKGYRRDEIIGHHFSIFYPEDARQKGRPRTVATDTGVFEDEGWARQERRFTLLGERRHHRDAKCRR